MGQRVAASWPMSYGPPGADRQYDVGEIFELAGCVNDRLLLEKHYLHHIPDELVTVRCPVCAAEFAHEFEVTQHVIKRHGGGEAA
jgi:hypothetical protein